MPSIPGRIATDRGLVVGREEHQATRGRRLSCHDWRIGRLPVRWSEAGWRRRSSYAGLYPREHVVAAWTDEQDREMGVSHHLVGHGSRKQGRKSAAAVSGQRDERDLLGAGSPED